MTAHIVATLGGSEMLRARLTTRVTDEELEMMKEFGIEDGDGYVSRVVGVVQWCLCSILSHSHAT